MAVLFDVCGLEAISVEGVGGPEQSFLSVGCLV